MNSRTRKSMTSTSTPSEKTKYFFCSDLHGVHPKQLLLALAEAGYQATEPKHILVVAGDITDALGYDNELVRCLKQKQELEGAIIVKGNHDRGVFLTEGHVPEGSTTAQMASLSKESKKWLETLPVQLETEHFYLAHGM